MSNIWEAKELWLISGNAEKILVREKITGNVEIMPDPTNKSAALILRPVEWLLKNHSNFDAGKNLAFYYRTILTLTQNEAWIAFSAKVGDELQLIRKGWGEMNTYRLRKL